MRATVAYALTAPGEDPKRCTVRLPELGIHDIELEVSHCGVCASDLHLVDGDFEDMVSYPHVCGHEIVGTVTEVGSHVTSWQLGERAGVGWQNKACLECEYCLKGEEQHCPHANFTCCYESKGGFADRVRADSRFAYRIPSKISSSQAAPLLCAGHTVFSALRRQTAPGQRVGVIGIGGLGHLAIQFASKMGCIVSAISSNPNKADEARHYGANEFVNAADDMSQYTQSFDLLLVTTPSVPNFSGLIDLMRPFGSVCFAGMVKPIKCDIVQMMERTLSISTANAGGRSEMNDMFEFAAAHNVRPTVEQMPMADINTALERLRKGDARYRIVLINDQQ